jgi:hypothetical protein
MISCTKPILEQPSCQRVYMLADWYDYDTNYLRTDTLWPWGRYHNDFCGNDTLQFVNGGLLRLCEDSTFEMIRYVIGNKITQPWI